MLKILRNVSLFRELNEWFGKLCQISYSVLAIEKNCNKTKCILIIINMTMSTTSSHVTLQPKTGCPLKLSRVEYLDGRPPEKTRLLFEVLVRPAGGAHPVVCVGPNAPV